LLLVDQKHRRRFFGSVRYSVCAFHTTFVRRCICSRHARCDRPWRKFTIPPLVGRSWIDLVGGGRGGPASYLWRLVPFGEWIPQSARRVTVQTMGVADQQACQPSETPLVAGIAESPVSSPTGNESTRSGLGCRLTRVGHPPLLGHVPAKSILDDPGSDDARRKPSPILTQRCGLSRSRGPRRG